MLWWQWLQWQWWGLDLAWTQWWLSFDQQSQAAWLRQLFGSELRWLGMGVVLIAATGIAIGLGIARQGQTEVPRGRLQLSLKLLKEHGFTPRPGETFTALCHRTAEQKPELANILWALAQAQQELSYAQLSSNQRRQRVRLWHQLERSLARQSKQKLSRAGLHSLEF